MRKVKTSRKIGNRFSENILTKEKSPGRGKLLNFQFYPEYVYKKYFFPQGQDKGQKKWY